MCVAVTAIGRHRNDSTQRVCGYWASKKCQYAVCVWLWWLFGVKKCQCAVCVVAIGCQRNGNEICSGDVVTSLVKHGLLCSLQSYQPHRYPIHIYSYCYQMTLTSHQCLSPAIHCFHAPWPHQHLGPISDDKLIVIF